MERNNISSSKYRGTVKGLNQDYEDEHAIRVEIEPASGGPKPKKGMPAPSMSRSEVVSAKVANTLKVGDEVEVVTMFHKVSR